MFGVNSVPIDEIVDFEDQVQLLSEMISDARREKILLIQLPGLQGKTCLLRRFESYCSEQNIPCSYVSFRGSSPSPHPHYTLARELFEKLKAPGRAFWTTLKATSGFLETQNTRGISVEGEAGDITAHNVAGGNIITNSVIINYSREQERLLSERWLREQLVVAFQSDVKEYAIDKGTVVCLFDAVEDITREDEDWLRDELLFPVRSGQLRNIVVVVAGKKYPDLPHFWDWEPHVTTITSLPRMTVEHIKEYGRRVGVNLSDEHAALCWRAAKEGLPFLMGLIVKNLAATKGG